jgi:hypothetical protein
MDGNVTRFVQWIDERCLRFEVLLPTIMMKQTTLSITSLHRRPQTICNDGRTTSVTKTSEWIPLDPKVDAHTLHTHTFTLVYGRGEIPQQKMRLLTHNFLQSNVKG